MPDGKGDLKILALLNMIFLKGINFHNSLAIMF